MKTWAKVKKVLNHNISILYSQLPMIINIDIIYRKNITFYLGDKDKIRRYKTLKIRQLLKSNLPLYVNYLI